MEIAEWLGVDVAQVAGEMARLGVHPIVPGSYHPKVLRARWDGRYPCQDCRDAVLRAKIRQAKRKVASQARGAVTRNDRVRLNGGHATTTQLAARVEYFGGLCWICGEPWEAMDHVIPVALGGPGWPSNLRPACQFCNSSKGGTRGRRSKIEGLPVRKPLRPVLP